MKCKNCKNDIKKTMNYCPYCSIDLSHQLEESKRNLKFVYLLIILILLVIILIIIIKKPELENMRMSNMVNSICNGSYDTIYTNREFSNQGIYECLEKNYVYYVQSLKDKCGYYECGKLYEFGYIKHNDIESIFPSSIYFYRKSQVSTVMNELKIALEANSE